MMTFFVSRDSFSYKVYFFWYKYSPLAFFITISMEYLFQFLYFQFMFEIGLNLK